MTYAPVSAPLSTAERLAANRRVSLLLVVAAVLMSAVCAELVGKLELGAAPLVLCVLLLPLIVIRPLVGLLGALVLVAIFEAQSRFDALMLPGRYLYNGLAGTIGVPGVVASPLELVLILVVGVWFIRVLIERRGEFRRGALDRQVLLFTVALGAGFVRGAVGGGDLYIAFWECRALLYIVACYFAATNLIRDRRHLHALLAILLIAPSLFALEGAYRRLFLVDAGLIGGDLVFDHDDPVFMGTMLLTVLAQQLFGGPRWQRWLGLALMPLVCFTMLASERRAGLVGLMIAIFGLLLVLFAVRRRTFWIVAGTVAFVAVTYLPLFWNSTSVMAQPARAVRSLVDPNDRDAASNEYRELEKINVGATIAANPVLGVGFGREFLFVVSLPAIKNWAFLRYEPHANILWVWLKLGAPGFIVFWLLIGSAIARATQLARALRDPDARTFAVVGLGSIIIVLCYSYVDTGLVSGRVTLLLGIMLGTLAVLDRLCDPASAPTGGTV